MNLCGIYGDMVLYCGGWRLYCADCGQFLYGPVSLSWERVDR